MLNFIILLSVIVAGLIDLRWHRIPNWLVLVTAGLSMTWHVVQNGWIGLWLSLGGMLLGMAVLLPMFLLKGLGAGDVKLLGALGAALTYKHILTLFVLSSIIAGIMALFRAIWSRALGKTLRNLSHLAGRFLQGKFTPHPEINLDHKGTLTIPFGVPLAIATWLFVFFGKQ
jgi:prepilin peptidase CpaA